MIVGLKVIIYDIHLSGNFKKLIPHKKAMKSNERVEFVNAVFNIF